MCTLDRVALNRKVGELPVKFVFGAERATRLKAATPPEQEWPLPPRRHQRT